MIMRRIWLVPPQVCQVIASPQNRFPSEPRRLTRSAENLHRIGGACNGHVASMRFDRTNLQVTAFGFGTAPGGDTCREIDDATSGAVRWTNDPSTTPSGVCCGWALR